MSRSLSGCAGFCHWQKDNSVSGQSAESGVPTLEIVNLLLPYRAAIRTLKIRVIRCVAAPEIVLHDRRPYLAQAWMKRPASA